MKKNFAAFAFFLLFFGVIPVSCDFLCRDSCGCGKTTPPADFNINELELGDFLMSGTFDPDLFYPKENLFKYIEIAEFEFLAISQQERIGLGFIQNAAACSPAPNKSTQFIADIQISNKKEWTSSSEGTVEIGADLRRFFLIKEYPTLSGRSIEDFLTDEPRFYLGENFYLEWNSPLTEDTELTFDLEIKLSNGEIFNFENEVMKIKM